MPNATRNTSPYELFLRMARDHRPQYAFEAGDFHTWRAAAWPSVVATLGERPTPVDPRPELVAEWQRGDLTCQRWVIDVCDGLSAVAWVNVPAARMGERNPGILCWHGHNAFGKEPVMGNDSTPALRDVINRTGTDYGLRMAEAGFVTFAVDWMGRGDLNDRHKPNHRDLAGDRDWCNLYYLHATMLGMTPLGMNLAFGSALVDFATTLPYVDPDRIGVMGQSGGGTMALWSALTDERLKATEIVCYSDLFADFGYRDMNYCGSQIAPGLYRLVDVPDLQGLLAPTPLLVDIGAHDDCFRVESATACHRRVKEIYTAANAQDRLYLNLFPGGHVWDGGRSTEFFDRHLTRSGE